MSEDIKWKIFKCIHCDEIIRMKTVIDVKKVNGEIVHLVCGNEVEDITKQFSFVPSDCYEGVAEHLGK